MKRIVLFSQPSENNMDKLIKNLFPQEMENKVIAYMPTDGHLTKQKYTDYWCILAEKNNCKFVFVDNMILGEESKIENSNILLITGGNTFELLNNLRNSKLEKAIINFAEKEEFVLAGFSAGAIVLSPNINIASQPSGIDPTDMMDENLVGVTDMTGLNIIDFEVWPHFYAEYDQKTLDKYQNMCPNKVVTLGDNEIRVVEK